MEPIYPTPEFFFPGTFEEEPPIREGNEHNLHQGGLDGIDPSYDAVRASALAGAIGFDPVDLFDPSLDTRMDVEKGLPQWGPPFIKFVDGRISELEKKVEAATQKWSYQTQTYVLIASLNTSATGGVDILTNANAQIFEPPPGFTGAIHRLSIVDVNHTLGAPYTNPGSWWELRANGDMIVGNSMVAGQGQLPVFATWGTRDAPRIRDGEQATLFMSGGPASTMLKIRMQISYDRTVEG